MIPRIPQAPLWARTLISEINKEFARRDTPTQPVRLPDYATDEMPDAAEFFGHMLWNTTISRICVSDGTNWLRQDTGATV